MKRWPKRGGLFIPVGRILLRLASIRGCRTGRIYARLPTAPGAARLRSGSGRGRRGRASARRASRSRRPASASAPPRSRIRPRHVPKDSGHEPHHRRNSEPPLQRRLRRIGRCRLFEDRQDVPQPGLKPLKQLALPRKAGLPVATDPVEGALRNALPLNRLGRTRRAEVKLLLIMQVLAPLATACRSQQRRRSSARRRKIWGCPHQFGVS